jgi:hypothetical protein
MVRWMWYTTHLETFTETVSLSLVFHSSRHDPCIQVSCTCGVDQGATLPCHVARPFGGRRFELPTVVPANSLAWPRTN